MDYRPLGKTGFQVSALSFGTVSLGVHYGIDVPGGSNQPSRVEAISLLREAAAGGINLFDTAPTYGKSESILGEALGRDANCFFATKVKIPQDTAKASISEINLHRFLQDSIEQSRQALQRDVLDILQLHNPTSDIIQREDILELLVGEQAKGRVRFLGASIYAEEDALAVIEKGCFDVLQVAYNLLDQRMAANVFPAAGRNGTGVMARSPLLKGVLTPRAKWMPSELGELQRAAQSICEALDITWDALPAFAFRFCLSNEQISTVLVGPGSSNELDQNMKAAKQGPLPAELLPRLLSAGLVEERLLNPSYWPMI